jgi:hypothetical protein
MSDDELMFQQNVLEGKNKFQGARMRGFWQEMISHLSGKPAELLSFEDIRARLRLREESYRGLQDVPLDRIVGSVGRYRDFTNNFLPRTSEMEQRWSRVYAQANSLEGLPPIELYKVDDVYFVRDGNHRVSVARQMGLKTIQAHVTELPTSVDLEPGMTREELDAAAAYAAFLDETRLGKVRPHHQPINLSEASRYTDLLGHIYLHGMVMHQHLQREVSIEEAAADWYDHVYRPAVTLIRKYKIMELVRDRTEGDLYLWLVDHLKDVKSAMGDAADERSFSDALVTFLKERKLPVPQELKEEDDSSVILTRPQIQEMLARRKAEIEKEKAEIAREKQEG